MNKYLKFEYWNTCDLGNIYYQGGQHFIFYLDADVGEPIHEEVEEGQENGDGDFIPTYRRQMKRYRIRTGLIPDYLIDAIQRMKLHDNIELTFKSGEIEQIYNVDCEVEWQFEKYAWQGTVTLTFDMDESITVGACCDNLVVQTLYWVAETGSDVSGDGTYANPWATLAYACSQVTTPGDVIHVKAGTIYETVQSVLAAGVSIIGAGATSIIKAGAALRPVILLASTTEGTNGNQSISYIQIDGDETAITLIEVYARSNVKIHNCRFVDSAYGGVYFYSKVNRGEGLITVYSENNQFYNNYVYNCSKFGGYGGAWNQNNYGVALGGQKDMLIHDNTIIQPDISTDAVGVCIGFTGWGQNCGTKIYNNTLETQPRKGSASATYGWGFAIELWTQRGGVEVYDNDIKGAIDFGGYDSNDDESYGYAIKVYDNRIGFDSVSEYTSWGILLENGIQDGVFIYRNIIENSSIAITLHVLATALVKTIDNINVYYNIFKNIRNDGATPPYGFAIKVYSDEVSPFTNLNVVNNVFYTDEIGYFYSILQCNDSVTSFEHINIINNIGVYLNQPVRITTGSINDMNIENNDMYNCGETLWYFTGCTVTNDTTQNNIITDPLFVTPGSDFHLQAGSPCINAGLATGLAFITTDYDEVAVDDPPEIGAFEYVP